MRKKPGKCEVCKETLTYRRITTIAEDKKVVFCSEVCKKKWLKENGMDNAWRGGYFSND